MSYEVGKYDRVVSDSIGVASAADVYTWMPGGPVEIYRTGIIATTSAGVDLASATSSFTMGVDLFTKSSAGSGWTRTTAGVASLNFTTSATMGINGKGIYADVTSPIAVDIGEQVTFAVSSAASAASTVRCFVEYRDLPAQGRARPSSAPGDGTTTDAYINMTKV